MADAFQRYVADFLGDFLPKVMGSSPHTIRSYKGMFVSLLKYMKTEQGIAPKDVAIRDLEPEVVFGYLNWLEYAQGCSASTRNNRLAALRSFCSYLQYRAPEHLDICATILSIKRKKGAEPGVKYMTEDAVHAILEEASAGGLRHLAMVQLLYDSAIRVQELIDLTLDRTCLQRADSQASSFIIVTGKGRKTRRVPITPQTSELITLYIRKHRPRATGQDRLFVNSRGDELTRDGVAYVLDKYSSCARHKGRLDIPEKVTPHMMRHSKATHLVSDGVPIHVVSQILGHSSVTTTEIYAKVTAETQAKALACASNKALDGFKFSEEEEDELLSWFEDSFLR